MSVDIWKLIHRHSGDTDEFQFDEEEHSTLDVTDSIVEFTQGQPTELVGGSTLGTLFGQLKGWINKLVHDIGRKQDILTAGDNITIQDNVISSTGGGGGGDSNLKLEFIHEEDYRALEEAGEVDWDTEYLITDEEGDRIVIIAYQQSEYSNVTPQRGTHVEDIDIADWNMLIEDPSDPVWSNCALGYYFIHTDDEDQTLIKIAHVTYDESYSGSYIYPTDDRTSIRIMDQVDYDAIISGGGWPSGFVFCSDTNNFYWQDHTIVENTPPVP